MRPFDPFEPWERAVVRYAVRTALKKLARLRDLKEDLESQLLTHWWLVRDQYDPDRGASPRTFMDRVVHNKLTDLPESFAQLTNLERLYLADNRLTKRPEAIAHLTDLMLDIEPPPPSPRFQFVTPFASKRPRMQNTDLDQ